MHGFLSGPAVGRFCIDLAIEKAKNAGIGWVSARGILLKQPYTKPV